MTNNAQEYLEKNFPKNTNAIHIINKNLVGEIKLGKKFSNLKTVMLSHNNEKVVLVLAEGLAIRMLWLDYNQLIDLNRLNLVLLKDSLTQLNLVGNKLNFQALEKNLKQLNLEYLILTNVVFLDNEDKEKKGLSLTIVTSIDKKLKHLSIENTELTYGLEHLPNSLQYFYPSQVLEDMLKPYQGNSWIEKVIKWKKDQSGQNDDEQTQEIRASIDKIKELGHDKEIAKVNSDWEATIWQLSKIVEKYSQERVNGLPIRIHPRLIADEKSPKTMAYVINYGKESVEGKGWDYHFALGYEKVVVVETIAHELAHVFVGLKAYTDGSGIYPDQQHSSFFWEVYFDGENSDLNFVKKELPLVEQKELEEFWNPLSLNFNSGTPFAYFPNAIIEKDWEFAKKLVFSARNKPATSGQIMKEWHDIRRKLFGMANDYMNAGTEQEARERWKKLGEIKKEMVIIVWIRPYTLRRIDRNGNEISIIVNEVKIEIDLSSLMVAELREKIEEEINNWADKPVRSASSKKVEKINHMIENAILPDLTENKIVKIDERLEETMETQIQVPPIGKD